MSLLSGIIQVSVYFCVHFLGGTSAIVGQVLALLDDNLAYRTMADVTNPFGDGRASQRIVQALIRMVEKNKR